MCIEVVMRTSSKHLWSIPMGTAATAGLAAHTLDAGLKIKNYIQDNELETQVVLT